MFGGCELCRWSMAVFLKKRYTDTTASRVDWLERKLLSGGNAGGDVSVTVPQSLYVVMASVTVLSYIVMASVTVPQSLPPHPIHQIRTYMHAYIGTQIHT